jgi:hypothetical protein
MKITMLRDPFPLYINFYRCIQCTTLPVVNHTSFLHTNWIINATAALFKPKFPLQQAIVPIN